MPHEDRPTAFRPLVEEAGDLRSKNLMTIPKRVVEAMGLEAGDRLIFVVEEEGSGHACIYRLPKSLAGIASDAYGRRGGTKGYLDGERESWDD